MDTYGAENTPLGVATTLYICTLEDIAIAVDPGTGKQCWRFDPQVPDDNIYIYIYPLHGRRVAASSTMRFPMLAPREHAHHRRYAGRTGDCGRHANTGKRREGFGQHFWIGACKLLAS